MSDKIADVGKADNQPVSAWSVIELQREVSKLGAENARLKETIAAQQRQIKRMRSDLSEVRQTARSEARERVFAINLPYNLWAMRDENNNLKDRINTVEENADHYKRESSRRGMVIERYESSIRTIAGCIEIMKFEDSLPGEFRIASPSHTLESIFAAVRALAESTMKPMDIPEELPQQEQEAQPVPVHPPCRVTHGGGE